MRTVKFLGLLIFSIAPSSSFVASPVLPFRRGSRRLPVATELDTEIIGVEIGVDDGVMIEAYHQVESSLVEENRPDYDEFDLREAILQKWEDRYDVNFVPVDDSFDFQSVYLNMLPLFRQESEYDYLCNLQAIVKILREHDQLRDYVLMSIYQVTENHKKIEEFDGYALRDAIQEKWGGCYDMDFQPEDSYGKRRVYLNVLPFRYGQSRCRFDNEYDYLCHLQGVVELLQEYEQLEEVLGQIAKTDEKPITRKQSLLVPRPGAPPSVAVSLELDLSPAQLEGMFA